MDAARRAYRPARPRVVTLPGLPVEPLDRLNPDPLVK